MGEVAWEFRRENGPVTTFLRLKEVLQVKISHHAFTLALFNGILDLLPNPLQDFFNVFRIEVTSDKDSFRVRGRAHISRARNRQGIGCL